MADKATLSIRQNPAFVTALQTFRDALAMSERDPDDDNDPTTVAALQSVLEAESVLIGVIDDYKGVTLQVSVCLDNPRGEDLAALARLREKGDKVVQAVLAYGADCFAEGRHSAPTKECTSDGV